MFSSFQTFCVRFVAVRKAFRGPFGKLERKLGGATKSIFVRKDTLYNANRID